MSQTKTHKKNNNNNQTLEKCFLKTILLVTVVIPQSVKKKSKLLSSQHLLKEDPPQIKSRILFGHLTAPNSRISVSTHVTEYSRLAALVVQGNHAQAALPRS